MKPTAPHRADDVARAQQLGEWLGGVALAAGRWLASRRPSQTCGHPIGWRARSST
ncbi:MAG: hypothetical protein HS128_18235 [Ideonella sp.]|nr:hypothetical protein [Ideonella sp.]MCC7457677.1 hypothetical protein [Nitrospira sp.]